MTLALAKACRVIPVKVKHCQVFQVLVSSRSHNMLAKSLKYKELKKAGLNRFIMKPAFI
jgi:hypothetical protein